MAGIWIPLFLLLELSGQWEINAIIELGVLVLTTLGLIALGVILGSDSREMVATS
jgi:hypothetical protein